MERTSDDRATILRTEVRHGVRNTQDTQGRFRSLLRQYLDAEGKYHEEGGYPSRKQAEKAAARLEVDANRGDWTAPASGRMSFKSYVESYYWPTAAHLEVSTRAAYR